MSTNVRFLFPDRASAPIEISELDGDAIAENLLRVATKWMMRTRKSSGSFLAISSDIQHGYIMSSHESGVLRPIYVSSDTRASRLILERMGEFKRWVVGSNCPVGLTVYHRASAFRFQLIYIPIFEPEQDLAAWVFVE